MLVFMDIRRYHPDDDPALMALERLCPRGVPEPFVHYRRRFIDRAAIFPDHELLIAEDQDNVVGTIALCVKQTTIRGNPVALGYVFDARVNPAVRRQGIGQALIDAVDQYLLGRGVDGVYAHILSTNVSSLRLFAKMGYARVRQLLLLTYQPYPLSEIPHWMPRHTADHTTDQDFVRAVHGRRDLYVQDVADQLKDFGFQRWTLDLGGALFAGVSLFDQSNVFQQWPADKPFPLEEEMHTQGAKSLRLFDEIGTHNRDLLQAIFDTLRDLAVTENAGKLTLMIDRLDPVPTFFFSEANTQLDYWMVFKSLRPGWVPEWQDRPIYIDAREL
jgi:ribosomal protein S18 acetylase RimI-like enzyme